MTNTVTKKYSLNDLDNTMDVFQSILTHRCDEMERVHGSNSPEYGSELFLRICLDDFIDHFRNLLNVYDPDKQNYTFHELMGLISYQYTVLDSSLEIDEINLPEGMTIDQVTTIRSGCQSMYIELIKYFGMVWELEGMIDSSEQSIIQSRS